jgi:hypothetical protein
MAAFWTRQVFGASAATSRWVDGERLMGVKRCPAKARPSKP